MSNSYDVIIIGGGLAGLTAARELNRMKYRTLTLEAKDRLGGRAWTEERLGTSLELGGGWIHWVQPHVWSEITRYKLSVIASPTPQKAYWLAGNKVRSGTPEEMAAVMKRGLNLLLNETRDYIPRPFDPYFSDKLKEADNQSLLEMLDELDLSNESTICCMDDSLLCSMVLYQKGPILLY